MLSFIAFFQINLVINFLIAYLFEYYKIVQSEELDKFKEQLELQEVINDIHIEKKQSKNFIKKATIKLFDQKFLKKLTETEEDANIETQKKSLLKDSPEKLLKSDDKSDNQIERRDSEFLGDYVKTVEKGWKRFNKT